jgi:tRNA/tmRNA/rRNA uracil-C5-methylase (TrmA/RlmC/RlmD family)
VHNFLVEDPINIESSRQASRTYVFFIQNKHSHVNKKIHNLRSKTIYLNFLSYQNFCKNLKRRDIKMMRDFGDDVFEGTAKYYVQYRAAYPPQLFDDIAKAFKLNGKDMLLDLGCGSGELAILLAKYFENVLALDPDEDMPKEAKVKAKLVKIDNIQFKKAHLKQ